MSDPIKAARNVKAGVKGFTSMAWKPIDTAPRDMKELLLWDRIVGVVHAYWDGNVWVNTWDSEEIPGQNDLLFWHPIPLPPGENPCRLS